MYIVIIPMLRRNELKNSLQRQKSMISALSRSSQKELQEQEGIGSKDPERERSFTVKYWQIRTRSIVESG